MKFPASVDYAIHGLLYLAMKPPGRTVLVTEVAQAIGVPGTYLRKVFQQLARRGLLASQRGARGGFKLAREAATITLKDVAEAVDGSLAAYSCLRMTRGCGLGTPCRVQRAFDNAQQKMAEVLDETSIHDVLSGIPRDETAGWLTPPAREVTA